MKNLRTQVDNTLWSFNHNPEEINHDDPKQLKDPVGIVSMLSPQPRPIVFFGDHFKGTGTIADLSEQGCTIQSSSLLQPGTHLTAQIMSSDSLDDILINEATVRWAQKGRCELEFTDVSEESQKKLHALFPKIQTKTAERPFSFCARCGSQDLKRTPRKGIGESIQSFFFWYPFRCRTCGNRFKVWQWGIRYIRKPKER